MRVKANSTRDPAESTIAAAQAKRVNSGSNEQQSSFNRISYITTDKRGLQWQTEPKKAGGVAQEKVIFIYKNNLRHRFTVRRSAVSFTQESVKNFGWRFFSIPDVNPHILAIQNIKLQ